MVAILDPDDGSRRTERTGCGLRRHGIRRQALRDCWRLEMKARLEGNKARGEQAVEPTFGTIRST